MDKNTILGLVLMVVVVLLFSWWMQPTPEQLEAQRRYNDSIAAVEAERMAEAALAETPVSTDTVSGEVADSLKNAERYGSGNSVERCLLGFYLGPENAPSRTRTYV